MKKTKGISSSKVDRRTFLAGTAASMAALSITIPADQAQAAGFPERAITLVVMYGAGGAGMRTMTFTSSPGFSLMLEGISYMIGAEVPAVFVNIMRGGPGLGNIGPEQADYNQMVKGGGHGNYKLIVLAPNSAQEMCDLTILAFELADKYRNPVMILGGLQPANEPGTDVGQTLVIEIHRILGRQNDAESEGAGLFEQREKRLLRRRLSARRNVAEDLIHVENRAQAGRAGLAADPCQDLVQKNRDKEHSFAVVEVSNRNDR